MADGLNVEISGIKEAGFYFKALSLAAPKRVVEALNRTRIRIESLAKENCPTGTLGALRQSIHGNTNELALTATVGAYSGIASYVEFGTAPHMPPVEALENWVENKFGIEGDTIGVDPLEEISQAAWALAMTIKEKGTQEHPFLFPAVQESIPFYIYVLQQELKGAFGI